MEPYIANAQNSRRQELLEKRLSERLNAICIPQLLPLIGGNDIPMAQSMVQAQLRNLRQTEPHLLSRATDFLSKVILERSKVVLQEHEERSRQSTLLARDHLISTQPTETELLRRTMKSEIISRFSKLTNALRREDRMQTGTLSPNSIRMLCRQFNLESATLDNALAACYLDAKGGGNIQYGPLVEMLMNKDYPDLFREDLDAEGGIMLGRSSLRRRQDGASGTMRIRPVPVDEWAVLTKNNNEIANAYEQQIDESKRREACNYGQQLRLSGQTRRQQQDQMVRTRKQKEKEEEDRKLQNYREEQQRIQERQAQIELSAWQEGQAQIRYKAERVKMTKDQEMADAKARVRKNNQDAENEYLNQMAKTQNERAEWRESLKQNIVQQQNKELLIQQERVDDFKRQEVYAEMLEKEHIARMGALESALSYQPPPSSIRAAEGITAKAKADEARAYRIQRLREAEANEADNVNMARRKREALEVAAFLRQQQAEKANVALRLKAEDTVIAQQYIVEVKDAIQRENEMQNQRLQNAKSLQVEQRRQARLKDEERNLKSGMSPRERAYNRDMFETMAGSPRSTTLSNTGRRLFG